MKDKTQETAQAMVADAAIIQHSFWLAKAKAYLDALAAEKLDS